MFFIEYSKLGSYMGTVVINNRKLIFFMNLGLKTLFSSSYTECVFCLAILIS